MDGIVFDFCDFYENSLGNRNFTKKDGYKIRYEKKSQIYVAKYKKRDIIKIEWR